MMPSSVPTISGRTVSSRQLDRGRDERPERGGLGLLRDRADDVGVLLRQTSLIAMGWLLRAARVQWVGQSSMGRRATLPFGRPPPWALTLVPRGAGDGVPPPLRSSPVRL